MPQRRASFSKAFVEPPNETPGIHDRATAGGSCMRIAVVTFVVLLLLANGLAGARQTDPGTPSQPTVGAAPGHHPSGERVPVPEPTEKALSYYRTGTILWVVD